MCLQQCTNANAIIDASALPHLLRLPLRVCANAPPDRPGRQQRKQKPLGVIFRGGVGDSRRLGKYSHIASLHLELTQDVNAKPCVSSSDSGRKETVVLRSISGRKKKKGGGREESTESTKLLLRMR